MSGWATPCSWPETAIMSSRASLLHCVRLLAAATLIPLSVHAGEICLSEDSDGLPVPVSSTADGDNALACGTVNNATGYGSTAVGSANEVTGEFSVAVGTSNEVNGEVSSALGGFNIVSGDYNLAVG